MDTHSLLTAKQLQDLLKIDRNTIYRMLNDGRLLGIKVGNQWRFHAREVDKLLSGFTKPNQGGQTAPTNLLPLHCIQPIQDVFSEIIQIGSVITDTNGNPLSQPSHACDFCKLILSTEKGYRGCVESWRKLAQQKNKSPEFISCHAGLEYSRARIEVNGKMIAILMVGQFYVTEPEPLEKGERVEVLAEKYQINRDQLLTAARQIPLLDHRTILQINGWLGQVANTFERISSERADLINRLRRISKMSVFEP